MNKHILLVIKWLDNPESVSKEELKKNKESAYAAYVAAYAAYATYAAYVAAYDAYAADADAADAAAYAYAYAYAAVDAYAYAADAADADDVYEAEKWVDTYFSRSGENRQDYISAIKGEKVSKEELSRIDVIGQNGNDGEHYDEITAKQAEKNRAELEGLTDNVNKPEHYQTDTGIECIDAIRAALGKEGFIAYCRGNAIKYNWRSGSKANHAEDLKKGAWYSTRAAIELEGDL